MTKAEHPEAFEEKQIDSETQLKAMPTDSKSAPLVVSNSVVQPPRKTPVILRVLPLLLLTGAFAHWSFISKIPVKVVGSSIILVPRSQVGFQARSNGRVTAMNVQPGDRVRQGQVLAVLEDEEVKEKIFTKRQELAQLEAENIQVTQVERERSQLERETTRRQREAIQIQAEANELQLKSIEQKQVALKRQWDAYEERIEQLDQINQDILARLEAFEVLAVEGAVARFNSNILDLEDMLQRYSNEKTTLLANVQNLNAENQQLISQSENLVAQNQDLQAQIENLATSDQKLLLTDIESEIQRRNGIDNLQREIANLETQFKIETEVVSPQTGEILDISTNVGQYVTAGTTIGEIQIENSEMEEIGLAFFTPENADRIRPGMEVELVPNLLTERRFGGTRERFGGIAGTVQSVSRKTVTQQEVASIVGSDQLAKTLMENPIPYASPDPGEAKNLPVVQVAIELQRDPSNVTGYEWIRGDSPNVEIPDGAIGEVRVILEERSLVSYAAPTLRWVTGIYDNHS
ncbi:MAG: NHLP bacteriocin system secretion protein [Microcoleaceae cyanobacterium]